MARNKRRSFFIILRNFIFCSLFFSSFLLIYFHTMPMWSDKYSVLKDLSSDAIEFMEYKETPGKKLNSSEVRGFINKCNQEELILNLDKFGQLKKDMIIMVVQVHKYRDTLKYLLASLCELVGIEDTLIIFSHSYLDDNVNKLIQSIQFCPVLQIFYPYSLQAYPNEFPGFSENDCPYDIEIEKAAVLNCTGAYTPDFYGRFREPVIAEKKHFWWWTANKVFQNLSCIANHIGIVIFLEDDLYIMQDFLYLIHYMKDLGKSFNNCGIISIRTDTSMTYEDIYRVEVSTWSANHLSSVLALDASVWRTIVANYDLFCTVDDSSWSRSLLYLAFVRGLRDNKTFKVVYSNITRVIKTSSCSHAVFGSCDVLDNVLRAISIQRKIKSNFFPPYIEVYTHIELENDKKLVFDVAEGGWKDSRDIHLCKNITLNKVLNLVLQMEMQFQDYNIITYR